MKKANDISVSVRSHNASREALVHHQDKVEKLKTCGIVYEIPCYNCELKYIGEKGRKFKTRLSEHQKDAKNAPQVYT